MFLGPHRDPNISSVVLRRVQKGRHRAEQGGWEPWPGDSLAVLSSFFSGEGSCCPDLHGAPHDCLCAVTFALWVSALLQAQPGSEEARGSAGRAWGPCVFCRLKPLPHWVHLDRSHRLFLPLQAPQVPCLPPPLEEVLSWLQSGSCYTACRGSEAHLTVRMFSLVGKSKQTCWAICICMAFTGAGVR